jgi:serine/threonine protein kinase
VTPRNILVKKTPGGKILLQLCDFQISRLLFNEVSWIATYVGTGLKRGGCWKAPEVLCLSRDRMPEDKICIVEDLLRYRPSSDIFVLGNVFYFIITGGKAAFTCARDVLNTSNAQTKTLLLQRHKLHELHPLAYDLIDSMTNFDEKERPTAEQALCHPFFWPRGAFANFLVDLVDRINSFTPVGMRVREDLEKVESKQLMGVDDWTRKIPPEWLDEEIRSRQCCEFTSDEKKECLKLLTLFRNKLVRINEIYKKGMFLGKGTFSLKQLEHKQVMILVHAFPPLVPHVWRICKKYYRFQFEHMGSIVWENNEEVEVRSVKDSSGE